MVANQTDRRRIANPPALLLLRPGAYRISEHGIQRNRVEQWQPRSRCWRNATLAVVTQTLAATASSRPPTIVPVGLLNINVTRHRQPSRWPLLTGPGQGEMDELALQDSALYIRRAWLVRRILLA